jgi:hypothetical protein
MKDINSNRKQITEAVMDDNKGSETQLLTVENGGE